MKDFFDREFWKAALASAIGGVIMIVALKLWKGR